MADEKSAKAKHITDIVTLLIGLASLIFADDSVFRSFFGILLLAVLIKDFRKPSTIWDRIIVCMSMAFATVIACSYLLTAFLEAHGWALLEDAIVITGLIGASIFWFVLKSTAKIWVVRSGT